jgi:hypothetical protein
MLIRFAIVKIVMWIENVSRAIAKSIVLAFERNAKHSVLFLLKILDDSNFVDLINEDLSRNSKTNSATITCAIRRIRSNWSQKSSTNHCEHFRSRWLNVRRYAKHLRKIANVYASRLMFELTRIMWWSRYCKITRKLDVQRRRQRASVNDRIAIQSSSYELSWTIFTDISSFILSNELRMTMSEMSFRDIRFWFSI